MINKSQYIEICNFSKNFMNKNFKNIVLLSIDEAHIIRPHPIFLNKYELLFSKFFYFKIIYLFLKNLFKLLYSFFVNIFKVKFDYNLKSSVDYIFISHFLNTRQVLEKKERDFYFSHFFKYIKKKTLLILFNHLNTNFKSKDKIILNLNEDFISEVRFLLKMLKEFFLFKKNFEKKKNIKNKKFLFFIYSNLLSVNTLRNIRIYYQVKKIIKKYNPKKIITTYEGHAFERNIFLAASHCNTKIEKIGFHHSIPFKNQFSYTMYLKNGSDPNVIMASGKNSYIKFSKNKNFKKIILIGSNRISRSNPNIQGRSGNLKLINIKNCLVIPEGIDSEASLLLNFCNDYLLKFNDIRFIIRLHPLLRSKIKKYQRIFNVNHISKNVIFSNNKHQYHDIKKCDLALYRGTSLIFDAVKKGLVPLYYSKKNEICFDPLSISENKNKQSIKISDIYEFNNIIKNNNIYKKNYYFGAYSYPNKKNITHYFK